MRRTWVRRLAVATSLGWMALSATGQSEYKKAADEQDQGCLKCHEGIEAIGGHMDDLSCVTCHKGDPEGLTKEEAHQSLLANPGDLSVAQETCGVCHPDQHQNLLKSLHATSAGVISGARYTWAAQEQRGSLYATRAVRDDDGHGPTDAQALEKLDAIPSFAESGQHVDDYLRKECLRCHVWTEGKKATGDYRSSGCTSCHMLYADDGLSLSGDPTIPKNQAGHPMRHVITSKIPAVQCLHCHNRGGRTGVSYVGAMEADPYGAPFKEGGAKQGQLHGKHYHHLRSDVHYEKGMMCIDCHTSREVHGDGNIYGKMEEAVEVRCQSCHGTPDEPATLRTARGHPLNNVKEDGDQVVLTSKYSGARHRVTQLKELSAKGKLPPAMAIPAHKQKLECYACHARWTPQCYGCHAQRDDRAAGFDWIAGATNSGQWQETRSYLRWETPVLGINVKGKVSPFVPGCQVVFTHVDQSGKTVALNKTFTTAHGHSGLAHNPIQPHTISKEARTCEDCHSSRKAQGLGTGIYNARANGLDIPFELERIVDEDGRQLQATSHDGARPFNKEELEKISRVNVCLACHEKMTDADAWRKISDVTGFVRSNEEHKKLLQQLLPTH